MTPLTFSGIGLGIVTLASAITAAIIGQAKPTKRWVNQLIAFIVTELVSFGAYFIGWLPALGEPAWAFIALEGLLLSLASMGLYSFDAVKQIWFILFGEPLDQKTTLVNEDRGSEKANALAFQDDIKKHIYHDGNSVKLDVVSRKTR